MEAIEFVARYHDYLDEIGQVIKPELLPLIEELKDEDPHDLVRPDTYFLTENHAKGFVWGMFLCKVRQLSK